MSGEPRGGSLEDGVRGVVDLDRTCLKYAVNGRDALLLGPPAASKSLPVTWRDHLPSPAGMSNASETDFGALLSFCCESRTARVHPRGWENQFKICQVKRPDDRSGHAP